MNLRYARNVYIVVSSGWKGNYDGFKDKPRGDMLVPLGGAGAKPDFIAILPLGDRVPIPTFRALPVSLP